MRLSINETHKNNTYFILSVSLRITGPVCRMHSKQTTDTWCRPVSLPHSIGTSQLCGCLQLPPKDTELCSWLCFSVLSAAMPWGGFEVCKGSLGFASLDLVGLRCCSPLHQLNHPLPWPHLESVITQGRFTFETESRLCNHLSSSSRFPEHLPSSRFCFHG